MMKQKPEVSGLTIFATRAEHDRELNNESLAEVDARETYKMVPPCHDSWKSTRLSIVVWHYHGLCAMMTSNQNNQIHHDSLLIHAP